MGLVGKCFVKLLETINDVTFFMIQAILCCNNWIISHLLISIMNTSKCSMLKMLSLTPRGRVGVYGGYQGWADRAGRFRSLGDGQVDFVSIFSKLSQYDFDGWAVLEWECCIKDSEQGAEEGAPFIQDHIIRVTERAFDDFAGTGADEELNRKIMGI